MKITKNREIHTSSRFFANEESFRNTRILGLIFDIFFSTPVSCKSQIDSFFEKVCFNIWMVSSLKLRQTFDLNFVWVTSSESLEFFLQNTPPPPVFALLCCHGDSIFLKICHSFVETLSSFSTDFI